MVFSLLLLLGLTGFRFMSSRYCDGRLFIMLLADVCRTYSEDFAVVLLTSVILLSANAKEKHYRLSRDNQ
jgi:hypothetical protein